jgi:hypothetical protein
MCNGGLVFALENFSGTKRLGTANLENSVRLLAILKSQSVRYLFPLSKPETPRKHPPAMATAAQVAATFLSFLSSSSSTHHPSPSSSVSLGTNPVLPVSLRAAVTGGPRVASRLRGRRVGAAVAQLPTT